LGVITNSIKNLNPKLMVMHKSISFSGQEIFVGLDVHKKSWSTTIIFNGLEHKTFSQPPSPEVLMKYLREHFPEGNYRCVYEAGFSGFWIQRNLEMLGAKCMVVNPADVPTSDKDKKRKTDRVDSRKLARSLSNEDISGIFIPNRTQEEERNLVRGRHLIVKDITRQKNRIKQCLLRYGISPPDGIENWNKQYMHWLNSIVLETSVGTMHFKLLLGQLEELNNRLKLFNTQMRMLAKQTDFKSKIKLLMSVPGIGLTSAMTLSTEIGDINRFISFDSLCSFVGLVPNTYSSGEKERVGRMTKRGNSYIRRILIEAAWMAIKLDPSLSLAYKTYTTRMKGNRAIIRIARKLLSRIHHTMKTGEEYRLLTP